MPPKPRQRDIPKIPGAVKFYRISAYITGVMLLLLIFEMVFKYTPLQLEMQLGGEGGFLVPKDSITTGFNLSTAILIAHGWLYVVYLFADFRLWSLMRWPFSRFLIIALGGVVPLLSFFVESHMTKLALREHAALVADKPDQTAQKPQGAPA
ncbi:DUF3817 domain-containing protein [Frigoribacterium faeni]|uniref:Membrane protein n=1 Tax=Frigoribacterium faeni TaxID=145483 RepID=A0A7W3JJG7_9MICO|nr:DUF3817 domain-containing protein [Frigoribacterium faeni]MBA8814014.1 integral membrane protein [Frigoribacterium faeni]BFF15361.1 DUF3817 domain-containing protein [Microbacterium flavescens]GEK82606.1 membrane protein [Frigoribacterium faeni]